MRFFKNFDLKKITFKKVIGLLIFSLLITFIFHYSRSKILRNENVLSEPEIQELSLQKVLSVTAQDDSVSFRKDAYLALYKTLYALKKDYPEIKEAPIRARFAKVEKGITPNILIYAMPVPNAVVALPVLNLADLPPVTLEIWPYGQVAQILYKGPHAKKSATLEKLLTFIEKKGYIIINGLEEEYLKGPGLFFKFDPQKYQTILKFKIKKPL